MNDPQSYADDRGFPTEDRTLALVAESLACVYSGAIEVEAAALIDALDDRGLRITERPSGCSFVIFRGAMTGRVITCGVCEWCRSTVAARITEGNRDE